MFNVYHFIYQQYGFKFLPSKQDKIFFGWLEATNRLVAYIKWKTANLLARAVGSVDMVACPFDMSRIPMYFDPWFGIMGLIQKEQSFHKMKLARGGCSRYVSFIFSLYQGKAASLAAHDWEVRGEVLSALDRLSTEKNVDSRLMTPAALLSEDDIEQAIDRTVDEVFPRLPSRPAPLRLPSRGAAHCGPRAKGGSMGALVRQGFYGRRTYDYTSVPFFPYDFLVGYHEGPLQPVEIRTSVDLDDFETASLFLRDLARRGNVVSCVPIGLTEPFKVRVITKGFVGAYQVARQYQPRFWSHLKNHPTFRLIGESISASAMRQFCADLDPRALIISGDYKQATDHIPSHLAERLLERAAVRLGVPFEDIPVLISTLTRHLLHDESLPMGAVLQRSGQLMGSPSSFPVLCLFNAAITRLAVETAGETRKKLALSDIPMLVNGDDLLLGANDISVFLNWKRVVGWAGLIPSIGKTLVSRTHGTINSVMFRFRTRKTVETEWVEAIRLPHIQLQLALGSMKSGRVDLSGRVMSRSNPMGESRMWHEFLRSCPSKASAWSFLFKANREYLMASSKLSPWASLVLPPEAGGLGFPAPPPDSKFYSSRYPKPSQLLLARMLLEEGTEKQHRSRTTWLKALEVENEIPSESIINSRWQEAQRLSGARMKQVPIDEEIEQLPPSFLNLEVATDPLIEGDVSGRIARSRALKCVNRDLMSYRASGREKPWTLAEVVDFVSRSRWTLLPCPYSSPLEGCRSYGG